MGGHPRSERVALEGGAIDVDGAGTILSTDVGIHAVDLVWGLGTLHCLTQQQPKA